MDIPKTRQYDHGKVEVFARNGLGEAYCWTTLEVRPRHDDYRLVLKNSPRRKSKLAIFLNDGDKNLIKISVIIT